MRTSTAIIMIGLAIVGAHQFDNLRYPVSATATVAERDAMGEWEHQNDLCRGSPDAGTISVACPRREIIGAALVAAGWCYAYSDWRIMPQEYRWHRCGEGHP